MHRQRVFQHRMIGEIILKNNGYKVALGGVVASLCLMLMLCTAVFPVLNMAVPLYMGAMIVVVAVEIDDKWAFVTYSAVSLLSFFITPDKEAVLMFVMLFGYYPILRRVIERNIRLFPARLVVKTAVFNAAAVAVYYLIIAISGMSIYDFLDDFSFLGKNLLLKILIIMNVIFIMYDRTLDLLESSYVNWFRKTYLGKK